MSPPASLSLVVCTYRRAEDVARLVASLDGQAEPPDEILVVDGSPDDETERRLEVCSVAGLAYSRVPPSERGLTRQRNFGVERAGGDIVAFLDDDTVPHEDYFLHLRRCFAEHPDAVGVGGYVTGISWRQVRAGEGREPACYRYGEWQRREDVRWRGRRLLRLAPPDPPGFIPASGHGRPISYLPPDGQDHRVESLMGCAFAVRRPVFDRVRFSEFFSGYGLYEDLAFCTEAARLGELYVCGRARVDHLHAPSGRPRAFRYGLMVSRNGWYVWRRRWPRPAPGDRVRWWATSLVLAAYRGGNAVLGPDRHQALLETMGRLWGLASILVRRPDLGTGPSTERGAS